MNIIGNAPSDVVSFYECERLVQDLSGFELISYGSKDWIRQHELISKLNIQAHINAMTRGEEYVMESLATFEKMPVLLHELLVSSVWKREILPKIQAKVADCGIKGYVALFHESLVLNLIDIVSFHKTALVALDKYVVDLVDYCYEKISVLIARGNKDYPFAKRITEVGSRTDELECQNSKLEFGIQMSSLSILRYISDHLAGLGVSAITFMVNERDVLMALVALIESRPWIARAENGARLVWEDNQFKEVLPQNYDKIPKIEGQVWLCIYNLIFGKAVADCYEITESRKNWLLRLKKYLNDILVDQIPVLAQLRVTLDHMSLANTTSVQKSSPFIIATIPEIKTSILKNANIAAIAKKHETEIFNREFTAEEFEELGRLGEIYTNDIFTYESKEEIYLCANCGIDASKRCSRCKAVWYCSKECQVKHYKESHKKVCVDASGTNGPHANNGTSIKVSNKAEIKSDGNSEMKLISQLKHHEETVSHDRLPRQKLANSQVDYEELS
jgi:hypothetical protein